MNTLLPVNQLFDAAFGSRDHTCSPNRDQVFKRVPRANILEGDKDYQIRMDLPGVKAENLDINLDTIDDAQDLGDVELHLGVIASIK